MLNLLKIIKGSQGVILTAEQGHMDNNNKLLQITRTLMLKEGQELELK